MMEHNLGSMIVLSATNYAIWKPRMEDILFCKDLHDPLENEEEKPIATKDEEWRKMNRKTIGLIKQCIGHEALLLLSSLPESWETLVVSLSNSAPNGKLTMSMVMDALFNEEARRREMGSTDQSESQALVSEGSKERGRGQRRGHHRSTEKGRWRSQTRGRIVRCFYCDQEGHIKRDCLKYKAQDQSSDTAAIAVMAVDESEVLLVASEDGKSDWILDSDSKGCSFDASGGTLRVSKGSKDMLWRKKTGGLYRLEGNVQTRGVTVRYGFSSISKKSGQGKQPLHRGTQSKRMGTWGIRNGTWRIRSGTRAQGDVLGYVQKSGQTRVVQPVQDVHRETQRKETKLILRSCTAKGAR
ncbi:hypothetical protein Acr_15g0005060 [Actinidia rufa]|uniref:CCHC-type domain-containing protein n=1 Tax=Actinidia rufa TaxID=165716 RepID=A0A7J0FTZ6_9ERIC|nr:hypothetical protein Acr_15g0005060 [Actinidia rufa]